MFVTEDFSQESSKKELKNEKFWTVCYTGSELFLLLLLLFGFGFSSKGQKNIGLVWFDTLPQIVVHLKYRSYLSRFCMSTQMRIQAVICTKYILAPCIVSGLSHFKVAVSWSVCVTFLAQFIGSMKYWGDKSCCNHALNGTSMWCWWQHHLLAAICTWSTCCSNFLK